MRSKAGSSFGATQLRLREIAGAEKSFREALRVNADDD